MTSAGDATDPRTELLGHIRTYEDTRQSLLEAESGLIFHCRTQIRVYKGALRRSNTDSIPRYRNQMEPGKGPLRSHSPSWDGQGELGDVVTPTPGSLSSSRTCPPCMHLHARMLLFRAPRP